MFKIVCDESSISLFSLRGFPEGCYTLYLTFSSCFITTSMYVHFQCSLVPRSYQFVSGAHFMKLCSAYVVA